MRWPLRRPWGNLKNYSTHRGWMDGRKEYPPADPSYLPSWVRTPIYPYSWCNPFFSRSVFSSARLLADKGDGLWRGLGKGGSRPSADDAGHHDRADCGGHYEIHAFRPFFAPLFFSLSYLLISLNARRPAVRITLSESKANKIAAL